MNANKTLGRICIAALWTYGCAAMQATPDANRVAKMLEDCGGPQRGNAPQPEKLTLSETADAAATYLRLRNLEPGVPLRKTERVAYTLNAMPASVDLGVGGSYYLSPERKRYIENCLREKYQLPLSATP
jgi:hypothetical protein